MSGSDVFTRIDDIGQRISRIFNEFRNPTSGQGGSDIRQLAGDVQALVSWNADAAVGAIHVDHDIPYNLEHPVSTAVVSDLLCQANGMDPQQRQSVVAAALSHDIGMIFLQELLEKHVAPLTEGQKEKIRMHSKKGRQMLQAAGVDDETWLDAVEQHHERLDGSGYPERLRGDQIGLAARIVAVTDIYTAMVRHRGFRPGFTGSAALREMLVSEKNGLDQRQLGLLVKAIGIYPPGVLVKLDSGEVAIVAARGGDAHKPQVAALVSSEGELYPEPVFYDTSLGQRSVSEEVGGSGGTRKSMDLSRVWNRVVDARSTGA